MTADLAALLPSWQLHLRAARKSPETIKSYTAGVTSFLAWCAAAPDGAAARSRNTAAAASDDLSLETKITPVSELDASDLAALTPATVNAWVAHLLADGAEPATARSRQLAVRRFSKWLAAEGEIDADLLAGLSPPKLDVKVTQTLTEDGLTRLLKACEGRDIADRRDAAMIRLMIETGIRAGELLAMRTDDIDLVRGLAVVRKGKGGTGRTIPFGPRTAAAIDRYLRLRRGHRLAATPQLWLGHGGKGFAYHGMRSSLGARAEAAGIPGFHAHLLRHTAATRWLKAGGSEGGLMAVCGWKRREMLDRYTRATAADRAADESRTLGLGEL